MSAIFDYEQVDLVITVPASGNSKYTGVRLAMHAKHLIVKPPAGATYIVQLEYDDGMPARRIPDAGTLTGIAVKDLDALFIGTFDVYIRNASLPGDYRLRFVGFKARV